MGQYRKKPIVIEAITFVPGVKISEDKDQENKVIERKLISIK